MMRHVRYGVVLIGVNLGAILERLAGSDGTAGFLTALAVGYILFGVVQIAILKIEIAEAERVLMEGSWQTS